MQILIVSPRGMLVKSESMSILPIDNVGSCSHISANLNESLTVYSFLVKGFNLVTKKLSKVICTILENITSYGNTIVTRFA